MIIVKFTSGLGNQMFQYSLYTLLIEKYPGVKILADTTWFGRSSEHQGFELTEIFERDDNPQFEFNTASYWDILRCTGRFPNTLSGTLGDVWQNVLKIPHNIIRIASGDKYTEMRIDQSGFEDNGPLYDKLMNLDCSKDWYISGFFIEEVYYKNRLQNLRDILCFDTSLQGKYAGKNAEKNRRLMSEISSCHSVSIHVRRGDYLSKQYSSSFIALSMNYYEEAVKRILDEHRDAHFFIFSDDKEYIENAFDFIDKKTVVSINSGKDSYRDLQLMSLCRENIVANSTFSIWAGLLNRNENAKVYYPAAYMKQKDSEIKTIPGWIRI